MSVVIPIYNKERYVRTTLESVLGQTHEAAEIILIDDGSTDKSIEFISDLLNDRVRLVAQENAGPGAARNRGIDEAREPWVAFIDADDLWRPNHLETLAEVAKQFPSANVVASKYQVRSESASDSDVSGGDEYSLKHGLAPTKLNFFLAPLEDSLCSSSLAVRRSTLLRTGNFELFWPGEDVELWIRLALDNELAISQDCTAVYRRTACSLMSQKVVQDRWEFADNPIFRTLDAATADPRQAGRRSEISLYRDRWLRLYAKQALRSGGTKMARTYIRAMSNSRRHARDLRLVSMMPGWVVRLALDIRSWFRGRQDGV